MQDAQSAVSISLACADDALTVDGSRSAV